MSGAPDPPAALVLGAAVWPGGAPSPALARRIAQGAALYHRGEVGRIICCGGLGRHGPSEAEVMARELLRLGVPAAAILREGDSRTTRENLRNALPLLGAGPAVIVTDAWHAPRARLTARMLGLRARAAPVPGSLWPRRGVWMWLREAGGVAKLVLWLLRGRP